jgi:hypothetical protein
MVKTLKLCLLLLIITMPVALCQQTRVDSVAKAARKDVKHFKLDNPLWKQFKHKRFAPTSDYFKPNTTDVSDTSLLKDSTYVNTYRMRAYKSTLHRHTAGHYFLVYGGITIGAIIVTYSIIVISIINDSNFL